MKEFVIGYDAREMWLPRSDYFPSERYERSLLRDDIVKPLSVDRLVWKSLFHSNLYVNGWVAGTVPDVPSMETPDLYRAYPLSYWSNLNALQTYLTDSWKYASQVCWLIAISGFAEADNIGYDIEPREIDPQWKFLGYDVSEESTYPSALSGFFHESEEAELLKNRFAEYINPQHLLTSYEVADEFRKWADQRDRGHSPNYVYGLYLIATFPKPKQAAP